MLFRLSLLSLLLIASSCVFVSVEGAIKPVSPPRTTDAAAPLPSVSDLIKVVINPSRSEVVPNGSYGVYADVQNISSSPVVIYPNQTSLVVLPEASEPSACVDWEPGIFPTQNERAKREELWANPLIIQPAEHYLVFWDLEPSNNDDAHGKSAYHGDCILPPKTLGALGFVPGDYAFTVEGNAYIVEAPTNAFTPASASPDMAQKQVSDQQADAAAVEQSNVQVRSGKSVAHHFAETKTLRVGISQLTTLGAAMLGAFMAYWIIALKPKQDWDAFIDVASSTTHTRTRKWLAGFSLARNALLAALLGGVVTIVASRLSDTHFPVKVSVSDFWGALTVGFVSYFIGNKFIDSLVALGNANSTSTLGKRTSSASQPSGQDGQDSSAIAAP